MSKLSFFLIFSTVLGISIGQIFFKLASGKVPDTSGLSFLEFVYKLLSNWHLLIALGIYMATTFLWVLALKDVELVVAYPFMSLAYVFVPLLGYFFLGESLSLRSAVGILIIMVGLIVAST